MQTGRRERRQAVQALHRPVPADVPGHPGREAALDLVHAVPQPGRHRRVQRGPRHGHVPGRFQVSFFSDFVRRRAFRATVSCRRLNPWNVRLY